MDGLISLFQSLWDIVFYPLYVVCFDYESVPLIALPLLLLEIGLFFGLFFRLFRRF